MAINAQVYTLPTFVTGATQTPGMATPGVFLSMYLIIPTMSTGYAGDTQIWVRGSADGVNYYRFANVESNTFVVGTNDFTIASSVSQKCLYLPSFSFPYMKVEVSGAVTSNISLAPQFKVVCISNQ